MGSVAQKIFWQQIFGFLRSVVCPLYHYIVDKTDTFSVNINELGKLAATEDVFTSAIVAEMMAYMKCIIVIGDKALLMFLQ